MSLFFLQNILHQQKQIILALMICFCIVEVSAKEISQQEEEDKESLEEMFIEGDIAISKWFDNIAEKIDLFITRKKITRRKNETNVKLSNGTYYDKISGLSNSPSITVNLRLPNVEDYWNLKFTSVDETKDKGVRNTQLRKGPQERNLGATVGLFQQLDDVNVTFQPRIELRDPLSVGHSLNLESVAEFKTYRVNPRLEFYANPEKGTGIFHALNYHFRLSKIYSFNIIYEGEYEDKKHLYSVTNGVSLGQAVTKKGSLSYGIYLGSISRPNYRLDSCTLAITWGHVIYNKILDYSITPQLNFEAVNAFTGIPGISLNISLNF